MAFKPFKHSFLWSDPSLWRSQPPKVSDHLLPEAKFFECCWRWCWMVFQCFSWDPPKKGRLKTQSGLPSLKNDVVEQKTWPLRENCAALGGETDDNHQQSPGSQWTRNSLLGSQNDNNSKFIFCSPSWPPGYRVWCDLVLERPFSTSSTREFCSNYHILLLHTPYHYSSTINLEW